ncbi:MAG: hypothetical protein ACFB2W_16270 [Leptolyngbyaceae cyanobacterium]
MTPTPLYAPHNRPSQQPRKTHSTVWIFGSLALMALAIVPQDLWPQFSVNIEQSQGFNRTDTNQTCQAILNPQQRLSRDQLTQFLAADQDSPQTAIHETIAPPYCMLSRTNQTQQQEAYPLAFDPDTWFVVNYDQGIYKGYDFLFKE